MPVIQTNLIKRFPNRKETIKRLFKESENFKAICEDYRKCSEALHHWNESAADEAPARRDEYTAFLLDLETEILQSLNELE